MSKFSGIDWFALILIIVGGINWGLVGAFNINLVSALFGDATMLTRLVYIIVGVAGVYSLYSLVKMGKG